MENKFDTNSFNAIVDENSEILILGTVPGQNSIGEHKYYNDNRNQFWKIIYSIFDKKENVPESYANRKRFLYKNKIALWDVYRHANRGKSSKDRDIKKEDVEFNNIKNFLIKYPNIKKILLNGGKSKDAFEEYIKNEMRNNIDCKYQYVPSSSGGNFRYYSFEDKKKCWEKAITEQ